MNTFAEFHPTLENRWRSVILFGRNVASYKFAMGQSLLELATAGKEIIQLDELAKPFSKHLCKHLALCDKQTTSQSSRFLDICRKFNTGELREEELFDSTAKLGFNNVIDAFHIVHQGEVGVRFFTDERAGREKGIRLTQDLFRLAEDFQYQNLPAEIEARWRLVETAWELRLPRSVLTVDYDVETEQILVDRRRFARRAITGARGALNGYQKGKCFYCFADITVEESSPTLADVDHFFPHILKPHGFESSIDEIWNLVLACQSCNRGESGKFARLPEIVMLERLHTRNNFYIESHHPLRETLIQQTGDSEPLRRQFLQDAYNSSKVLLGENWRPLFEHEPAF